jgi:4-cresol dehydrogenase (hydroxylating) flavoprotein subunit
MSPAPPAAAIARAVRHWRAALGDAHVRTDAGALAAAQSTTYPTSQRVVALLRPADVAQVRECVRIAGRTGVPLYPVSTGKNWGYGSRVPAQDGCAVLELGRLTRILDYDEELCCVSVEPGVTQEQLHRFLQERGGRLWMDGTGSTPVAGPLGNTLERGFGLTPYGDHVGRACAYEVVLPDGELLRTGYRGWPGARSAAVDRWSPGPQLDGLFSQSNLGVVTRISIPLMPAPERTEMAVLDIGGEAQLGSAVDVMRSLQLDGTVRAAPWFGNHYRVLGVLMRFPWHRTDPPLRPELSAQIAAENGLAPWTGFVALHGSGEQVAASRRRLIAALRGVVRRVEVVDAESLAAAPVSARRNVQVSMHRAYTGGLLNAAARAYWRKRQPAAADADPDRDGVGFVFNNTSLPFRGDDVLRAQRIAAEVILAHGFEPAFSCHSIRERVLQGLSTFAWDREVDGDDARALAAHDEVARRWAKQGWHPFRLGLHSMGIREQAEPVQRRTVAAIKAALDPAGIIAPGRYA